MNKGEREALQVLIRQRERVLKSAAKQRSSELLADFENQLGSIYSYDNDATWAEAARLAKQEVAKAQTKIAARAAELGIPKDFAPKLSAEWYGRGANAVKQRRTELRVMAKTRIAAIEAKAIVEIEMQSVEAQTQIAQSGLTSEAASQFLERLRPVEELMPTLSFEEVAGKAETPIAEQLTSPGALRQRRFRERHKDLSSRAAPGHTAALHNAQVTPSNALSDDGETDR
jgi:hypothetical protein